MLGKHSTLGLQPQQQVSLFYISMAAYFYPQNSTYHVDPTSYNLVLEVLNITSSPGTPGHVVICQSIEA